MRFHFNWARTFSRIAANAIVNPSKTNIEFTLDKIKILCYD